jgi:hypothetical protein
VKLNLHDPKVRRRVLIGAGAGAALLALLFARHKGAPSSTAAAPVGTDPGIDPATGIPYALEAQDPGLGPGGAGLGVTAADPGTADPGPAGPVGPPASLASRADRASRATSRRKSRGFRANRCTIPRTPAATVIRRPSTRTPSTTPSARGAASRG